MLIKTMVKYDTVDTDTGTMERISPQLNVHRWTWRNTEVRSITILRYMKRWCRQKV